MYAMDVEDKFITAPQGLSSESSKVVKNSWEPEYAMRLGMVQVQNYIGEKCQPV